MEEEEEIGELKQYLLSFDPNSTEEFDFSGFGEESIEEEVLKQFFEKIKKTKTLETLKLEESIRSMLKNDEKLFKNLSQSVLENSSINNLSLSSKKKKLF